MLVVFFEHSRFIYHWQYRWRTQDLAKKEGADSAAAEDQGGSGAMPPDVNGLLRFSHKKHSF